MINSLRSRNQFPPHWDDLERNTISQLHRILIELSIIPPRGADRDELIRLIKMHITPRKMKPRSQFQHSPSGNDSDDYNDSSLAENNSPPSDNGYINVNEDQIDELPPDLPILAEDQDGFPSPTTANTNSNINNINTTTDDDTIPYPAVEAMADDEFSNSVETESGIITPNHSAEIRQPSKLFPLYHEEDNGFSEKVNDFSAKESNNNNSYNTNQSSSYSDVNYNNRNNNYVSKRVHFEKSQPKISPNVKNSSKNEAKSGNLLNLGYLFLYTSFLLFAFIITFQVMRYVITAVFFYPPTKEFHCPKNGICEENRVNGCNDGYILLGTKSIKICAPLNEIDEYSRTLEAAEFVAKIDGDCIFRSEKTLRLAQLAKMFPKANTNLLLEENDFRTVSYYYVANKNKANNLENKNHDTANDVNKENNDIDSGKDNVKGRDNNNKDVKIAVKSESPDYPLVCRVFKEGDQHPALSGLTIIILIVISFVFVRNISKYIKT